MPERLRDAIAETSRGRFGGADALLSDPGLSAWARAALEAARFLAGVAAAPPTLPDAVPPDEVEAATLAMRRVAMSHLLSLDGAYFAQRFDAHPAWEASRAWARVVAGEAHAPSDPAADDPDRAGLVIEHTAMRALAALHGAARDPAALEEATALARRASRMARTEGLPQSTYLANVILARVRRFRGRPWLAARILRGLADVAPPAWHPWLAWEMAMASGRADPLPAGPSSPAACSMAALGAARAGDRRSLLEALDALDRRCAGVGFLAHDGETLRAALDVEHEARDPSLRAFARGELAEPPRGMVGIAGLDGSEPDVAVCVAPDRPARRILWLAAPLHAPPRPMPSRPGRTETALAVLAFAGREGLSEAELFRRAYGFAYERELHKGVLGVLVHRMRAWTEDLATVHREEGHTWLEPHAPFVLPDPRCERPSEARVLVLLGREGMTTAKRTAGALGISVRGAQAALQALVEDGALERVKEGRNVGYVLEDTTFEEPTRA